MDKLDKIKVFFNTTLWSIALTNKSGRQRTWIKLLRVLALAVRGFREDKVSLRASALTVFTLLAVVPLVALAFGIAKGFGLKAYLEDQIRNLVAGTDLPGQEQMLDQIIQFANSFLDNTSGGIIAGIGLAILLWSVFKVFSNIESSFNAIWQIRKSRSWFRKFSDYFSLMLIGPVAVILSSSAMIFIQTQIEQIIDRLEYLNFLSPVILALVQLIPYVLIWLLFTFLYVFMPNTRVRFRSALIGGLVAGTAFVITQHVFINFQIGVSRYNAIYGSFAALPLFLIGMQISWLIVLFGAELSFADQNLQKYEFESDIDNMSIHSRKLIALVITHLLVQNFTKAEEPLTAEQISHRLRIPIRLVRKILFDLVECRILSEIVSPNTKERAYQPGQDVDNLTIAYVLEQVEHHGKDHEIALDHQSHAHIKRIVEEFSEKMKETEASKPLKSI
jgi:membrane protein